MRREVEVVRLQAQPVSRSDRKRTVPADGDAILLDVYIFAAVIPPSKQFDMPLTPQQTDYPGRHLSATEPSYDALTYC